jgi:type I restriction enzyme, S subunit
MTLKPYPAYKPSGVEWLGDVPEHWGMKRLKMAAQLTDKKVEADEDNPVPYIGLENIESWTGRLLPINPDVVPTGTANAFKAGHTLFGKLRPYLAKACNPDFDGLCSTELLVLNGVEFDRDSLRYALLSDGFIRLVDSSTYGSKMPRASWDFIGNCVLPIAPPAEQRAIADFLDRETGKIDRLVAKKRELIAKLKEERAALISRTVTRGLNPDAKMKPSGVEWLGDVPEGWDVKKLRHLSLLKSGESITASDIDSEGEYPVYGGNGLRGFTSSYSHEGHHVLIGRQGALCGNVNYANGKFWASEHAVVVRPFVSFEPIWMGELLRAMNLNQYSVSAAQPGLSVDTISALKIPVPPLPEQRAIADFLDRETSKIDRLAAKVEKAIARLQEYRAALITAAVTGKIDVRGEVGAEKPLVYPEQQSEQLLAAEKSSLNGNNNY